MSTPINYTTYKKNSQSATTTGLNSVVKDDQSLWRSLKSGNEAAFVEIYKQHFQMLYDLGRQFSGDYELVKDCIQDVFVVIRMKRSKLPMVSSIKAYLLRAVRNKILTEIRDSRKNRFSDITKSALNFQVVPSYESVLINRQFNDDQISQIRNSLSLLSERQREAIYHFYYSNLSYTEIRDIMNFGSIKAARNLIYRALAEIRKTLNDCNR